MCVNVVLLLFCADGDAGILFSNGENWREMRRFALSNMRDFGMGKRRSEEKIIEETRHLIDVFEKLEGKNDTLPASQFLEEF